MLEEIVVKIEAATILLRPSGCFLLYPILLFLRLLVLFDGLWYP